MNQKVLVQVERLTRHYGHYCAVNDVSFVVHQGETLGLLGPNGAGKSTTMLMLCGLLSLGRGRVTVAGHDMSEAPKQAKQHIGFLPEQPPLYRDLRVDEYLRYAARLRGVTAAALPEALEYSKRRCGLADNGRRLIGDLSKGFQQRVGIAQAIIHKPLVVVLDEPTVGLDPNQIVEIRKLIGELGKTHSVILSTHILSEAQSVCDRALIIHRGCLTFDKPLRDLQNEDSGVPLRIALRRPPDLQTLAQIQGVMEVTQIDAQRFRLCCEPGSEAVNRITEQSVASAWELYEMIPEHDTLETVFTRLTQGETRNMTEQSAPQPA